MGILCVYLIGVHLPSVRLTGVVSVHLTGVVSVHLSHKLASYRRTSHSPYVHLIGELGVLGVHFIGVIGVLK
jgi:hypothetical protein